MALFVSLALFGQVGIDPTAPLPDPCGGEHSKVADLNPPPDEYPVRQRLNRQWSAVVNALPHGAFLAEMGGLPKRLVADEPADKLTIEVTATDSGTRIDVYRGRQGANGRPVMTTYLDNRLQMRPRPPRPRRGDERPTGRGGWRTMRGSWYWVGE